MEKGFTLIIPLYNKFDTIRRTLDSVLNNHGSYPFKCIIVDDDSTDGSSEIALEYDKEYPDIFRYIKRTHHETKTPAFARNLGIKLTETEYIGFLDADDELCSGFIDRGCNFLDGHPEYSMYGCGHWVYDGEKMDVWKYWDDNIRTFIQYIDKGGCLVCFCANIYKTKLVQDNLFTDVFQEDCVFQLKYVYRNEPIYIDNSYYDSFVYRQEYSEYNNWSKQRTNHVPQYEILDSVRNDIPDFRFEFWEMENGSLYLKEIKKP